MSKRIKESPLTQPVSSPVEVDRDEPKDRRGFASLEAVLDLRRRGFSLSEVGRQLGVSKQAVSQMLKRSGVDVEAIESFKKDKPFILHAKQKMVLDSITPKVVETMSGRDRFIATGILADKIKDLENPAHGGGITGGLWISIVQKTQHPEVDITPEADR